MRGLSVHPGRDGAFSKNRCARESMTLGRSTHLQSYRRSGNDPPHTSLTVRRVVTGHDENGRAIVSIDETFKNVVQTRPGAHAAVIWTSEGFPVDNDGSADTSGRKIGISTIDNGTVFRVMSFGPGVTPRNHRTDTIDYATVVSGEIDMELDGTSVHLKAGDVLVQRGTLHNWVNNGTVPCVIAFALIAAKSVTVRGKVLKAHEG